MRSITPNFNIPQGLAPTQAHKTIRPMERPMERPIERLSRCPLSRTCSLITTPLPTSLEGIPLMLEAQVGHITVCVWMAS